jgi:DNA-binding response OmpR family regulator
MCDDDFIDLRCLLSGRHRVPTYQYKALYIGTNPTLRQFLSTTAHELDCYLDTCSGIFHARLLLQSPIYYSLLLLDDLPDATGAELAEFTRTLTHRQTTPIILVKELIRDEAE